MLSHIHVAAQVTQNIPHLIVQSPKQSPSSIQPTPRSLMIQMISFFSQDEELFALSIPTIKLDQVKDMSKVSCECGTYPKSTPTT